MNTTCTFAHDGLVVSVDAAEADLNWLREFLEPAFTVVNVRPDARVVFEAAEGPFVEPPDSISRTLFVLDSGPFRLPASTIADGTRLYDATKRITMDVTDAGRHVRIGYHASRLDARIRLLRTVREYAHNHSLSTGGLMLHAAAVIHRGNAVAIAGSKGAGKTTLALRLLGVPGVDYLSNDRVLVRLDRQPRAFAIPTVIAVRAGTLVLLRDATARLQYCGDFRESTGEREERTPGAPRVEDDTWRVSPPQLCAAIDRSLHPNAPLAAVLFPTGDRRTARPLHRLSQAEAAAGLRDALLCLRSGHFTSNLFVAKHGAAPREDDLLSLCDAFASRVPCFASSVSDDSRIEELAALLDETLEPRA